MAFGPEEQLQQAIALTLKRTLRQLAVNVSDAEVEPLGSSAFRRVSNAYEQLARARQLTGQTSDWQRSDGEHLMKRLWELRATLEDDERQ